MARLSYLGGETLTMDGTSKACTLPTNTSVVRVATESGVAFYAVNGTATVNSGGLVGTLVDEVEIEGLTSLAFCGTVGVKVHVTYWMRSERI